INRMYRPISINESPSFNSTNFATEAISVIKACSRIPLYALYNKSSIMNAFLFPVSRSFNSDACYLVSINSLNQKGKHLLPSQLDGFPINYVPENNSGISMRQFVSDQSVDPGSGYCS